MEPLGALSGGAGGMADAVSGIIEQRMKQAQLAATIAQSQAQLAETTRAHQQDEALKAQQLKDSADWRAATEAENIRQHSLQSSDKMYAAANAWGDQVPPQTFVPATDPIVPTLQKTGRMGLLKTAQSHPEIPVGPIAPGDTSEARPEGFTKLPSAKQQDTSEDNARQLWAVSQAGELGQARIEAAAARAAEAAAKADNSLVKVEHKDPETGRTVIEWLPKSQVRGKTFQKGESAGAETRLNSAEAVTQTGEDIINALKDPKYVANVGPVMGRYNTIREFIGNPPPEFAELAGKIESYSLATMGVHGMRNAQAAEKIQNFLNQKATPEALSAGIRGLNDFGIHLMQNEGRMPVKRAAPDGSAGGGGGEWIDVGNGVRMRKQK
jgi:hypothetical protein